MKTRIAIFLLLAGPALVEPAVTAREAEPQEVSFEAEGDPAGEEGEEIGLEEEFLLLEDVETVTSASRHEQVIGLSPSAITALTRQQIATSGAFSLPDLLRRVPGLGGVVASPLLTGISGRLPFTYENNQLLVLIDGRQANLELLGQPPWELQPIEMEDIERIEIIRGPGSALYGANAFAGVVSIFTRTVPERDGAWATVSGGEFARLRVAGRASLRRGDWGASLSAGFDRASNFDSPRTLGKRVWKLRALGQWQPAAGQLLRLDAGLSRGEGPVPTGAGRVDGSLRLATVQLSYERPDARAHLYYVNNFFAGTLDLPLAYGGLVLAEFRDMETTTHTVDGELQWTLPAWWQPLLLMAGGRARVAWLHCPYCLADEFDEPTASGYHQPGQEYFEARAGIFLHGELSLLENLVLTASGRLDYNTQTGLFLSPRLAAVLSLPGGHFLRLGAARSFRKPAFLEKSFHLDVAFPSTSPLQGDDQMLFREFMSRSVGNEQLGNETLWAWEAGYHWRGQQWSAGLELYANLYGNGSLMRPDIVLNERGLPDLYQSSFQFTTSGHDLIIMGVEAELAWQPVPWLRFEAGAAGMGVWDENWSSRGSDTPTFSWFLGGEFRHPQGLLGSLLLSGRGPFTDSGVENPQGLLEPYLVKEVPAAQLLQGRMGWNFALPDIRLETGCKFLLPFSLHPFSWRVYDHGGGVTAAGKLYGGTVISPTLLLYLEAEL